MMDPLAIILAIAVAALGSGGLVSFLHLRTVRDKTSSEADLNKVSAQDIIISALQEENTRLSGEVENLRLEVAELRGHLEALDRLKVDRIADRIVEKLVGEDGALV